MFTAEGGKAALLEGRREMFAAKRERGGYSKTWKRERRCLQQKEEREHCGKEKKRGGGGIYRRTGKAERRCLQ